MSKPHDGAGAPTREAARKRRRRKRTRRAEKGERPKSTIDVPQGEVSRRGSKDASTPGADQRDRRSVNGIEFLGKEQASENGGQAKRRRRRRRSSSTQAVNTDENEWVMRNIRPAVVPVPDARYVPPAKSVGTGQSKQGRKRDRYKAEAFAALDLGTNNCRLLIAVPTRHRRIRVIDAFSRIVRLGEGMTTTGRLDDRAMERAIEALRICAAKLSNHRIVAKRLIATEACRRAENGSKFLNRVKRETGLELEIVDRETEARLAAEGCGELMDRRAEGAVLFDIGGGSSELVLVNRNLSRSRRISSHIASWTSIPLGVVTLAERFGGREVSLASFDSMVGEVLNHLNAFEGRSGLAEIWEPGRTHLLGTSGTVTTIAGVHLQLPRYDRRRVDGIWLSEKQIDKVIGDLLAMDFEMRARNPCIGRERADLVLAGCAILQAIRQTWPSDRLRVADRGLREGMLSELMHRAGAWDRGERRNRPAQEARR